MFGTVSAQKCHQKPSQKNNTLFCVGIWDMLVVLGVRFWQLFANIWCREAIVNEKGEPVFLSIVVWFRMIGRVHRGLKIINVINI